MADTPEQAQLRQHLHEIRRAMGGIGKDFSIEVRGLEGKISKLPQLTGKELKYAMQDIQDDFGTLAHKVDQEFEALPGNVKRGAIAAGGAISDGASRAATATKDAMIDAGHQVSEGTKNTFAKAAGLKRTPMKQWHAPPSDESPPPENP